MTGAIKGRGARRNPAGRFARHEVEATDDGWDAAVDAAGRDAGPRPATEVRDETARRIISRNSSPDVGFEQSVNPYRGCEHGCSYCFARPTHSYLDLSPGLDFETRLTAKTNAAERLRAELARPGHRPTPIALGVNTDSYQPIERERRITRQLIEVLAEARHPFHIITKNALVERDIDLLAPLAAQRLVAVSLSITTLDNRLAARMEPRASAPHRRLAAVRALGDAGIPTSVMVAPVIPALTDHELEAILEAARDAGAGSAGYVLLRLPHELKDLFRDWLATHMPLRAAHVMSLVQQLHGGRDYDPAFGQRMRGSGPYATLLAQRFAVATRRLGFGRHPPLEQGLFVPPAPPPKPARARPATAQGELF